MLDSISLLQLLWLESDSTTGLWPAASGHGQMAEHRWQERVVNFSVLAGPGEAVEHGKGNDFNFDTMQEAIIAINTLK